MLQGQYLRDVYSLSATGSVFSGQVNELGAQQDDGCLIGSGFSLGMDRFGGYQGAVPEEEVCGER